MTSDNTDVDGTNNEGLPPVTSKAKPFDLETAFTTRSSVYFLHSGDNPSNKVVNELLKGQCNYATWSKDMMLWLVTRRKQKFINGKISRPTDENSEEFEAWETVNGVVFSWIINACEKSIAASIRSADSAAEAWEILKVRYSQGQAPLRFQIGQELANLYQGNMTVSDYYVKLKSVWDDLQDISKKRKCTCDLQGNMHLWCDSDMGRGNRARQSCEVPPWSE